MAFHIEKVNGYIITAMMIIVMLVSSVALGYVVFENDDPASSPEATSDMLAQTTADHTDGSASHPTASSMPVFTASPAPSYSPEVSDPPEHTGAAATPVFTPTETPAAAQLQTTAPASVTAPPATLAPTAAPTSAPTQRPAAAPTAAPTTVPVTSAPATPTPTPPSGYSSMWAFFSDAVYCGDSILDMYHWAGNSYKHPDVFGNHDPSAWLAVSGASVWQAVASSFKADQEPLYKGRQCKLWEAIPDLGKHNVFLSFGMNDLTYGSIDRFIQNYRTLVTRIQNTGFKCNIYILSITPMRADKQKEDLNNANIILANERLKGLCSECGCTYVDVATPLRGADNALLPQFSDGTNVHLLNAAYTYWDEALKNLAARVISR